MSLIDPADAIAATLGKHDQETKAIANAGSIREMIAKCIMINLQNWISQ